MNTKRIAAENYTLFKMFKIYCHSHHSTNEGLCSECASLLKYAEERIDNCVFGADKPVCEICPIHCYGKKEREQQRKIMRYVGPKMIYKYPILAINHIINKSIDKRKLPELMNNLKKKS